MSTKRLCLAQDRQEREVVWRPLEEDLRGMIPGIGTNFYQETGRVPRGPSREVLARGAFLNLSACGTDFDAFLGKFPI